MLYFIDGFSDMLEHTVQCNFGEMRVLWNLLDTCTSII